MPVAGRVRECQSQAGASALVPVWHEPVCKGVFSGRRKKLPKVECARFGGGRARGVIRVIHKLKVDSAEHSATQRHERRWVPQS